MFENVLVAVDGSPHSIQGLEAAVALSHAFRGRLTVMTVLVLPEGEQYAPGSLQRIFPEDEAAARALVDGAIAQVGSPDRVEKLVVWDQSVAGAILDQAERGRHDLIVLGSRRRGPVLSALLGTVRRRVVDHSPVPVLVVRDLLR